MLKVIARIENDYTTKFGVPRQSGLVNDLISTVVFGPECNVPEAVRGLEEFSHIWLIWGFHEAGGNEWSPTVRPPRLGGNRRIGVFATRSPYRPNRLGLSCVRLEKVLQEGARGTVLQVRGADLMNGTPIYDIKPYLPYADAHPEASGGFTDHTKKRTLQVKLPEGMERNWPEEKIQALKEVLALDPRPAYQQDPERIYAFEFAERNVRFQVRGDILQVLPLKNEQGEADSGEKE